MINATNKATIFTFTKLLLGVSLGLWSLSSRALSDRAVAYFSCKGYDYNTTTYWEINGQLPNFGSGVPVPNNDGSFNYILTITNLNKGQENTPVTQRHVTGRKGPSSFIIGFFKRDSSNPSDTEGVLTIENTSGFPVVKRFVAHAWLAENPVISTSAFDFICDLQ